MVAQQLVVRQRIDSDLGALSRVLTTVHLLDGYPVEGVSDPLGWLVSSTMLGAWVAVADCGPVGHIMLTTPSHGDAAVAMLLDRHGGSADDVAVLERLFVAPEHRRRHAARQLMAAAMAFAEARGRRAVLEVMDKDRAAVRLYEALGWRSMGPLRHVHSGGRSEAGAAYAAPTARQEPNRPALKGDAQ